VVSSGATGDFTKKGTQLKLGEKATGASYIGSLLGIAEYGGDPITWK